LVNVIYNVTQNYTLIPSLSYDMLERIPLISFFFYQKEIYVVFNILQMQSMNVY